MSAHFPVVGLYFCKQEEQKCYHSSFPKKHKSTFSTLPIFHPLPVSDCQTLLKSCSIESRSIKRFESKMWSGGWNKVQYKDFPFYTCLVSTNGQGIRLLNHWRSVQETFILILKPLDVNFVQKCQKCQLCAI